MPRLRYLKNYEQLSDTEDINNREESSSETPYYEGGKGWWSNANVIASLPDDKIKAAIKNYQNLISLLQAELLGRSSKYRDLVYSPVTLKFCEKSKDSNNNILQAKRYKRGTKKLESILIESGLSENKRKELIELWRKVLIK